MPKLQVDTILLAATWQQPLVMQIQLIPQCCQRETSGVSWKNGHLHNAKLSIPLTKTTALHFQLGVVIHVCNPSTLEAEAGR